MSIAGFNSNAGQTANMTFTLSHVLDRQNQFPSILLFEFIVFQGIKEQKSCILFHYS